MTFQEVTEILDEVLRLLKPDPETDVQGVFRNYALHTAIAVRIKQIKEGILGLQAKQSEYGLPAVTPATKLLHDDYERLSKALDTQQQVAFNALKMETAALKDELRHAYYSVWEEMRDMYSRMKT